MVSYEKFIEKFPTTDDLEKAYPLVRYIYKTKRRGLTSPFFYFSFLNLFTFKNSFIFSSSNIWFGPML